ncbi:DNA polymerase IV 1 [Sporosarcina sp. NCCP-2716]|uniref:DNA polymerase IV n=1 Tax=Sporosarcina sp. NCCP-2716 TaxID=2943679 RepID=UPI00203B46F4|nr:DNA polymerase IV [Sporosarcina sp. NCCP-2716]GKV68148.1 DNA polymerase IV 1 [Sporosarcina sp. NCCP-2716]
MEQRGQTAARVILHLDMNCFFASVEQAHNPELKGLALAVAGNPKARRGILVTCSYEARAFGVYTTMTVGEAKRLCPELVLVPPDGEKYREASRAVFAILRTYTDLVEPVSIDEAYIDITDIGGLTDAVGIAEDMQQRILRELDLPCSIGIAPNKFLAKTASDMKKPMGITILRKRELAEKLWPLPVLDMHGVGKSSAVKLEDVHIRTIGELAAADDYTVKQALGKRGVRLKERAKGNDHRPVDPEAAEDRKSVGSSTTLPVDETELDACIAVFGQLAAKVENRLGTKNLAGTSLSIQIRTAAWRNQTRSTTLLNPIYRKEDIFRDSARLFRQHWDGEPIRLLGITVSNVIPVEEIHEQLSFDTFERHSKEVEMERLVSHMNEQFGEGTIQKGSSS